MINAIKKLYDIVGYDTNIIHDIHHCILTQNSTRSGRDVLWYIDDSQDITIYIDTLELLSEEDKQKELY